MENLTRLFDLFMYGALIFVVLAIILGALYFRWRAAGAERGI